jgi:DNA-binding NtrC family response regulator
MRADNAETCEALQHSLALERDRMRNIEACGELLRALSTVLGRDMIAQALADCAGNKSKAAARLGISRTQLYVRLRRYQLS